MLLSVLRRVRAHRALFGASRLVLALGAAVLMLVSLVGLGGVADAQRNDGLEYDINADPSWQVSDLLSSATVEWDSHVWDFAELNGRMYVVGRFGSVRASTGGVPTSQPYIAAFDLATGAWISTFTPTLNGPAFALEVSDDGQRLFVGGEFDTVNGAVTGSLVALNPVTGAVDTSFDTDLVWTSGNTVVMDLEVANGALYAGGNFNRVNSAAGTPITRSRLVKLNQNTGYAIGTFNTFVAGARVFTLDVSPDNTRVYIGGYFSGVNNTANANFAVVDANTGALVPGVHQGQFTDIPVCCGGNIPFAIESFGDKVWVASESHNLQVLAASDLSRIGFYHTQFGGGDYQAIEVSSDGRVYTGGHYWATQNYDTGSYPGGLSTRDYRDNYHVFDDDLTQVVWTSAYDAVTGEHDPSFLPDISASSGVWAIHAASDGSLWVGGDLTRAGYRGVGGFAKFSPKVTKQYGDNLAVDGTASQSSISGGLGPELGNDVLMSGRGGDWFLTTNTEQDPWWEVDLGAIENVGAVRVWRPGNCCGGAINGIKVFVSTQPFGSDDPAVTEADPGVITHTFGNLNRRGQVDISAPGRYVRVQLPRFDQLVLDEVQVLEAIGPVGPVLPVAPVSCTVVEANGGVDVSWVRAADDNAARFVVRRSRNGNAHSWAARVDAPGSSWSDANVTVGSTYGYRVEAANADGVSAFTTCSPDPITVVGNPVLLPVAPVSCTVVEANGGVDVAWVRAGDDNATRFVVRRSRNGNAHSWAASVNAPGASWSDANVSVGSSYGYRVETRNDEGVSAFTTCSPDPITVVGNPALVPVAPVSCVTTLNGSTATVSFVRAANDNAEQFVLRRVRDGGTRWWAGRVDVPLTSITNGGLVVGSTYDYEVETVALDGTLSAPVDCGSVTP
jgi:hypothetical protein